MDSTCFCQGKVGANLLVRQMLLVVSYRQFAVFEIQTSPESITARNARVAISYNQVGTITFL